MNRLKNKFKNYLRYFATAVWNRLFTYMPFYGLRWFILKYLYMAKIEQCNIHMGVKFFSPWKLQVGKGSNIQGGCFLDCRGGITIGTNVDITLGVKILSEDHDVRSPNYVTRSRCVTIGDDCVVGSFSVLLPGSIMEKQSVLGAGSVLVKRVPNSLIYAGAPAKEIGERGYTFDYLCTYKRPFH